MGTAVNARAGTEFQPLLAAIPQGAKEYERRAGANVRLLMLDQITQFDFYDQPSAVSAASAAVAEHFAQTLP